MPYFYRIQIMQVSDKWFKNITSYCCRNVAEELNKIGLHAEEVTKVEGWRAIKGGTQKASQ